MPNARKRRSRKKIVRKRRKNYLPKAIVPDAKMVRLKYSEFVSIDAATGLAGNHIFSANNVHDPNVTGTGSQPLGYDEWSAFYNHYTVLGAKCKATFFSAGSDTGADSAVVGIDLKADTTLVTDTTVLLDSANSRIRYMTTKDAGNNPSVVNWFSAKKFFHVKDLNSSNRWRTAIGASPNDQAYFHIFLGPISAGSNPTAVQVLIQMEYIVLFSERKSLASS